METKTRWERVVEVLGPTRTSLHIFAVSAAMVTLVVVVEWRLFWDYFSRPNVDWLFFGIWGFMMTFLMLGAQLKKDLIFVTVGLCGGLLIEGWGTQTELWVYYTELPPHNDPSRPPWWILPAWPISALAINRMYTFLDALILGSYGTLFKIGYWLFSICLLATFIPFTFHTWDLTFTKVFYTIVMVVIMTPGESHRKDFLILLAGASLGYFLEYWGTTRRCWIYYNAAQPPIMAVLAHGLSSVAFSRVTLAIEARMKPR